jgi:hypothetical protein
LRENLRQYADAVHRHCMNRPLRLYEAAWLLQRTENATRLLCETGQLAGAYRAGKPWLVDADTLGSTLVERAHSDASQNSSAAK